MSFFAIIQLCKTTPFNITNIVTHGQLHYGVTLCSYLPVLHMLPVHPGSQTQVPGLLQTPFSQGGTQTAEERTQQMAT